MVSRSFTSISVNAELHLTFLSPTVHFCQAGCCLCVWHYSTHGKTSFPVLSYNVSPYEMVASDSTLIFEFRCVKLLKPFLSSILWLVVLVVPA